MNRITTSAAVQEEQSLSSLAQIEKRLEVIRATIEESYSEAGALLREIQKRELYIEDGFETFDDYLNQKWNISKSKGYNIIAAAKVAEIFRVHHVEEPSQNVAVQVSKFTKLDQKAIVEKLEKIKKKTTPKVVVEVAKAIGAKTKKETDIARKIRELEEQIASGPRGGFRAIGLQNELKKLQALEQQSQIIETDAEIVPGPSPSEGLSGKPALLAELEAFRDECLGPKPVTVQAIFRTVFELVEKHV